MRIKTKAEQPKPLRERERERELNLEGGEMIQPEIHKHLGILSPVPEFHRHLTSCSPLVYFSLSLILFFCCSLFFQFSLCDFFFLGLIAGCGGLGRLGCGKMLVVVCFSNSLLFVCKMQCFLSMLHSCLIIYLRGIWPLEGVVVW